MPRPNPAKDRSRRHRLRAWFQKISCGWKCARCQRKCCTLQFFIKRKPVDLKRYAASGHSRQKIKQCLAVGTIFCNDCKPTKPLNRKEKTS
jgi:hypothetical protein